mmetsp:Transcript_17449/g.43514  ORF Transcript_17449/g.43514 Transcript_17449/m.43514 type:complete len:258 (-) Transcript_17449:160-933(-)
MDQTVTCVILLQGSKKNQCNESHQEQNHHEGVENRKPVDGVFEELVIQVTVEARVEFIGCRFELDVEGEFQFGTFLHQFQRLRVTGEIDHYNLVIVVRNNQVSCGVDVWMQVTDFGVIDFYHVIQTFQIILFLRSKLINLRKHLSNHSPEWQVVEVHLIKPTMLNSLSELIRFGFGERFRATLLGCFRLAQKLNIVTRVAQGMASEVFSHCERFPLIPTTLSSDSVGVMLRVGSAIGEFVIFISFLRVRVRTNLVYP